MQGKLAVVVVVLVGALGAASSRGDAADDIATLAFGVVVGDACNYECRECSYHGQTGHDIVVGQTNGNSSSHLENCGPGDCKSHSCNDEFPEGEELWFAMLDATGDELFALLNANPNRASFNPERASIQLICSKGEVIASLPLSSHQVRELATVSEMSTRAGVE